MKTKNEQFSTCPNCGNQLNDGDRYCSNCGQANKSIRHSFRTLITNFFEDYIAFDSKLIRTLVPLITKPGFLTLEFIKHKRSSYVAPLRLYLFISFIFFLITSLINKPTDLIRTPENPNGTITVQSDSINLDQLKPRLDSIAAIDLSTIPEDEVLETRMIQGIVKLILLPRKQRDSVIRSVTPIALILTIPIMALFLHLFNWKHKRYYVDDVVFISHGFSVALLLALFLIPVTELFDWRILTQFAWFIGILVYFIISFKKVYEYSLRAAMVFGFLQFTFFLFLYGISLFFVLAYISFFKI